MPPKPITTNTLYYGDNLDILREYIADASIDLVYLDPPFNSNRNYNVLFKDERGAESEAQITAAAAAGYYHSPGWGRDYPKIQIRTIEDLLHGAEVQMPPEHGTFKHAQRVQHVSADQLALDVE